LGDVLSAHCAPLALEHSYFVVMVDYGRRGREANVDPEITHREVIARIRSREYDRIHFIHWIHDGVCEDVTNEMLTEAGFYEREIEYA
jgi:hypothetical protein